MISIDTEFTRERPLIDSYMKLWERKAKARMTIKRMGNATTEIEQLQSKIDELEAIKNRFEQLLINQYDELYNSLDEFDTQFQNYGQGYDHVLPLENAKKIIDEATSCLKVINSIKS